MLKQKDGAAGKENMPKNEYILRAWYEKSGIIKYTAHRDLINIFYFSIVRAALPVHYTEGFTRKPKISFSPALPLGVASKCEFACVYLDRRVEIDGDLYDRLNRSFPRGIRFTGLEYADGDINGIIARIKSFEYSCEIEADFEAHPGAAEYLASRAASIAAAESVVVDYNGKTRDIKPYILACVPAAASAEGRAAFTLETALAAGSSIKAKLVVDYLLGEYAQKMPFSVFIRKERLIYND